jgi:cell volume regulation protein A
MSSLNWREKALLSWVGLRGSVPIVLATYPLVAGIARAEMIFNLVFFVSITSLVLQGTTISAVAKWLKVDAPPKAKPDFQVEYTSSANVKSNMVYVNIPANSVAIDKSLVEMKFPQDLLIVLIERNKEVIIPRGATQLLKDDKLLVLAEKGSLDLLKEKVSSLVILDKI